MKTEDKPVFFHKLDGAAVVLASKTGSYTQHDVYQYSDGRLFAKVGGAFVLLYNSGMTSRDGLRILDHAGFKPQGTKLGYMTLEGE